VTTATIRDLRTRFPSVRKLLEQEGEVVVTDRGRPVIVLQVYRPPVKGKERAVDYLARLKRRMPKPISAAARHGLDEEDRAER
jgi:antitoxin (DNA-binding transcriptional repressor) of toxin-antitoxin stability system